MTSVDPLAATRLPDEANGLTGAAGAS